MRILAEDEGFAAAEHCALQILVDLVRNNHPNSA
jgi:hypothetical protein